MCLRPLAVEHVRVIAATVVQRTVMAAEVRARRASSATVVAALVIALLTKTGVLALGTQPSVHSVTPWSERRWP